MKNMKNRWIMIAGVITAMAVTSVQATPITGGISLSGDYTVNNGGNLNIATAFTSFTGVEVTSMGGSYVGAGITMYTPGSVTMNAFSFNPFPVLGLSPLWTTTMGTLASFDLFSPISVVQGSDALTLSGVGILHLAGYDPTPGTWVFTANQGGDSFSFSLSCASANPTNFPNISKQPVSQFVSSGTSASFSVTASGAQPLRYQWQFNGQNISNATNATLNLNSVTATNSGGYSVVVSNPYGSVTSSTAALKLLAVDTTVPCYLMTATPLPDRQPGKNNLVLVTHGWAPGSTEPPPPQWVSDLCSNLQTRVPSDWQVVPYFWVDQAWTYPGNMISLENSVLGNAQNIGTQIGRQIDEQGWQHVHLIAHSAGSALIQSAADAIRSENPSIVIHTTFLDPFLGLDGRGVSWYGSNADWSDNYYDQDAATGVFTQGGLPNAYNVDVSWLYPNYTKVPYGIIGQYVAYATHDWPHDFFNETVTNISASWCGTNYGFALSEEGSRWSDTTSDTPGNVPLVLCGSSCAVPVQTQPIVLFDVVDVVEGAWSAGATLVGNAGFILNSSVSVFSPSAKFQPNGSPIQPAISTNSTGTTAWLAAGLTITNAVNFIQFDAAFTDTNNAEGLLTVLWDTNQIGTVDERVVSPDLQTYRFFLPNTVTNGVYVLGFRLDSFDNTSSSITVTNVVTGFVGITTPLTLGISITNTTPLLQLTGASNYNYLVESSTNLVDWTPTALLVNSNGMIQFTDTTVTNSSTRFYRAVLP